MSKRLRLRKPLHFFFLGGLAILTLAGQAGAMTFGGYSGPITVNLTNWEGGTLYSVDDGTYDAAQLGTLPDDPTMTTYPSKTSFYNAGGSDSWGVVRVNSITATTSGTPLFTAGQGGEQIVGIIYGSHDQKLTQATTADMFSQQMAAKGMQLAFFDYPTYAGTPSFAGGPSLGSGSESNPFYTGVTNMANLLWTMRAVPGYNPADSVNSFFTSFQVDLTSGAASSSGHLLADLTGLPDNAGHTVAALDAFGNGPGNSMLATKSVAGAFGNADISLDFTAGQDPTLYPERGDWLLQSNDPVAAATPEPATLSLLVLGGLALWRTRRSK
jgi:hypothetical protein